LASAVFFFLFLHASRMPFLSPNMASRHLYGLWGVQQVRPGFFQHSSLGIAAPVFFFAGVAGPPPSVLSLAQRGCLEVCFKVLAQQLSPLLRGKSLLVSFSPLGIPVFTFSGEPLSGSSSMSRASQDDLTLPFPLRHSSCLSGALYYCHNHSVS